MMDANRVTPIIAYFGKYFSPNFYQFRPNLEIGSSSARLFLKKLNVSLIIELKFVKNEQTKIGRDYSFYVLGKYFRLEDRNKWEVSIKLTKV